MKRIALSLVAVLLAFPLMAGGPKDGKLIKSKNKVKDRYIVVLEDRVADVVGATNTLNKAFGGRVGHLYQKALKGFSIELNEQQAQLLAASPLVKYVEEDAVVQADTTQSNATWGIDRIDQRDLPLSTTYTYNATGAGVKAYIIDTGINIAHNEFGGRAINGFDAVDNALPAADCNGHGTHVAGTVGGATYGVAKGVTLVAVRVLDCNGSGTNAGVIAGVNWVASDHAAGQAAVANMSLGGGVSQALDDAVNATIADGVTFGVAAGNGDAAGNPLNACNGSPSRVANAITVSATSTTDTKASWANYGTCVDIFAPGVNITSSWYSSNTATNTISGTSMATPHVVGVAALYLSTVPSATPSAVASALINNSTLNKVVSPGTGSPNRLLYMGFIGGGGTPAPTISGFSPVSGAVGATTTITGTNFTGATSVKIGGQAASFSVSTSTQITAVVPNCSANGTVSVTTAGGTATSAGSFSVTGCTVAQQLLLNPGFESGNVSWTTTAGVIDSTASPAARTGAWKAWLCGYGTTHADNAYQQVTIPATATSATLTFWLRITTGETTTSIAYDTMSVQVLNSSGTVLATLATYSNLNASASYSQKTFDLTAYKGQTIRVRFNASEDSSLQTSFLVDDTALNVQ
ncbi:MAG TPA: S8 family serine peptidase [Thermoanaerobaculia bacterium]|nr:S8 family serine peptidase [Thermoanaerobaculia bacterium]